MATITNASREAMLDLIQSFLPTQESELELVQNIKTVKGKEVRHAILLVNIGSETYTLLKVSQNDASLEEFNEAIFAGSMSVLDEALVGADPWILNGKQKVVNLPFLMTL